MRQFAYGLLGRQMYKSPTMGESDCEWQLMGHGFLVDCVWGASGLSALRVAIREEK